MTHSLARGAVHHLRHFIVIHSGTILAFDQAGTGGIDIMNGNNPSDVRVSNWTLATGTRPGERHVYPSLPQDDLHPLPPVTRP
jgi:hypothetical protein